MTTTRQVSFRKVRAAKNGFGVKTIASYDDGAEASATYEVRIVRTMTAYPQLRAGRWACECQAAMEGYECTHIQRAAAYRAEYELAITNSRQSIA